MVFGALSGLLPRPMWESSDGEALGVKARVSWLASPWQHWLQAAFSRDPMRIKGSGLPGDNNAGTPAKVDPATAADDSDANSAAAIADNAALDRLCRFGG
jgi:hypothetical protein